MLVKTVQNWVLLHNTVQLWVLCIMYEVHSYNNNNNNYQDMIDRKSEVGGLHSTFLTFLTFTLHLKSCSKYFIYWMFAVPKSTPTLSPTGGQIWLPSVSLWVPPVIQSILSCTYFLYNIYSNNLHYLYPIYNQF